MKCLRQFLDPEQQRAWLEGEADLRDTPDRSESLEHRFKYIARFEKLLRRPQAEDVLDILRLYGATCIPIPRYRAHLLLGLLPALKRLRASRLRLRVKSTFLPLPCCDPTWFMKQKNSSPKLFIRSAVHSRPSRARA